MKCDHRKVRLMILAVSLVFGMTSPAQSQTPASSIPYTIPNRGSVNVETLGNGSTPVVGEARVQPASSTTPAGTELLHYRQNGVLITEAGIPGTTAMIAGRTYAEVNGPIKTAIAFVNTTAAPVTISFSFTDQFGNEFGQNSFTLSGNAQIARFLTEAPFNARPNFTGTFSFSASLLVGVVAFRTVVNQRNELLLTVQTTVQIPDTPFSGTVILPHFVDGGGWKTQVFLVNSTDVQINGIVQFYGEGTPSSEAVPLTITVNGQVGTAFIYTIRPRSSASLETFGSIVGNPQAGSIRISQTSGPSTPSSFAVFSFTRNGVTASLTTEQAQQTGTAFRSPAEVTSIAPAIGAIQTGFAIANNSAATATVNFELVNGDQVAPPGPMASIQIGGFGHVARYLNELFPSTTVPFRGLVRISSFSSIAVMTVRARYNERGDTLLTSLPVSNEAGVSTTTDLLFPQIVDGGGYSTQFVLFSGINGQNATGTLVLLDQQGQSLNVGFR